MTDKPFSSPSLGRSIHSEACQRLLRKRHRAEKRFRSYGKAAIFVALAFLFFLFGSILSSGYTAFLQTQIQLEIFVDPTYISGTDKAALETSDFSTPLTIALRNAFPEAKSRLERRELSALLSSGADLQLRRTVMEDPSIIGQTVKLWLTAGADIDMVIKGHVPNTKEDGGRLTSRQFSWLTTLQEQGNLRLSVNWSFFTNGDSSEPELAGIRGALIGSFFSMLVTLALSFPLGVAAALYLEEFAPKNRLTYLIEVNINNLAAVPSIVFGLLGLAVFINFFGMPRSTPLTGGMVLSLMTMPTVIIAGRASLKAVPHSVREAAFGLGASRVQLVFHHILPLALPGMLTGAIIGMARALGETAPLLMIGMVAFIAGIPSSPSDPSTSLPVEIYLWSSGAERAFVERTSAAILVLLAFLILMNLSAILLRRKFERRW